MLSVNIGIVTGYDCEVENKQTPTIKVIQGASLQITSIPAETERNKQNKKNPPTLK